MKKILIAFLIFFSSCNRLTKGVVVEKRFEEGHYYVTMESVHNERQDIKVPVQHYEPSRYLIVIEGEYKGEAVRELWEVNKAQWDTLRYGSFWCINCKSSNY